MSRKTLFFLSSDNFHAQVWKNGTLAAPYYFTNTAEGLERFADFLRTHQNPAYILVDLIEEDFRQEIVPHLTGTSHQALVQRKFDQYYRNTPLRLAGLQQRQAEGRRDDEMLFSALTNPALVSVWLDLLLQNHTPIAGIYSIPHVSTPLARNIDSDHLLLLSWEKDAGLRQSYFLNQRLRFSRLTPINPQNTFANAIATESTRTLQYLQSLSLTPPGQLLNVHIICHANDRTLLDKQLASNRDIQYAYIDLQQLGKHIKSHYDYRDSDASPLFLHLLASQTPRTNYATPAHTHYYKLWQTRRGLFGLAAATAIICLVWSSLSFIEGSGVTGEIDSVKTQASRMMQETQQITRNFPSATQDSSGSAASASDMKTAVTLFRSLQQYSVPPEQILKGLAATLDNFPRIHTNKLGWKTGTGGNNPEQEISFNGELADFGNDYRGAINYLERFQLMLTRAGYSVTAEKLPLDFSSKGSISADIGNYREKPSEFALKIIWRSQQ